MAKQEAVLREPQKINRGRGSDEKRVDQFSAGTRGVRGVVMRAYVEKRFPKDNTVEAVYKLMQENAQKDAEGIKAWNEACDEADSFAEEAAKETQ